MKLRFVILFTFIAALLITPSAMALGENDTVRVDSVEAFAGRTAILPVYLTNDIEIAGFEVTLKFDSMYLAVDSFNFSDGRFDHIPEVDDRVFFNDTAHMVDVSFLDFNNFTAPGSGKAFNVYFSVAQAATGLDMAIDTAQWRIDQFTTRKTRLTTSGGFTEIPRIIPGNIRVLEAPVTLDSVYVDAVVGSPDSRVAVNVYGYNEAEVDKIDLAIAYTSDDVVYATHDFSGTRAETATSKVVTPDLPNRQLLISLIYPEASPLPIGEGILATLFFDISESAPDHTSIIFTEPFQDVFPTTFHVPSSGGGYSFEPIFIPGQIEVQSTVGVEEDFADGSLPKEFALAQNYPNPFNPSTKIKFALPRAADVNIAVYNILGEKIKDLVNENMTAGVHFVTFDGRGKNDEPVASGVYFYRINAGDFTDSKKMMLLK